MSKSGSFQKPPKVRFVTADVASGKKSWTTHDNIFRDIHKLGRTEWKHYTAEIDAQLREKPWKQEIQQRAYLVKSFAERDRDERASESMIQRGAECEIFKRFVFGVHCTKCQARLWRSEIESSYHGGADGLEKLDKLRAKRDMCKCGLGTRGVDCQDPGLNTLFMSKGDQEASLKGFAKNRPDRVFGLKATERINRILDMKSQMDGKEVREAVETSFYAESELIFPFIIHEAKAEHSNDSWSNIREQANPAICMALEIQVGLKDAVTNAVEHVGPQSPTRVEVSHPEKEALVWFLGNKGETWAVSAAYKDSDHEAHDYHVFQLWEGNITYLERALQLLLILDYICDWARDVYRTSVVDDLLKLVEPSRKTSTIHLDIDDQSLFGYQPSCPMSSIYDQICHSPVDDSHKPNYTTKELFKFFDRETTNDLIGQAAIRDAHYMEHYLYGIEITMEDCEALFDRFDDIEVKGWTRKLLGRLKLDSAWRVSGKTLDEIEKMWTGSDREHTFGRRGDDKYIVRFGISSCFRNSQSEVRQGDGVGWDQVHILTYIAVTEDALDIVRKKSELENKNHNPFRAYGKVGQEDVIEFLKSIRHANVWACLTAAANSVEMETTMLIEGPHKSLDWKQTRRGSSIVELTRTLYHKIKHSTQGEELNLPYFFTSRTSGLNERRAIPHRWPQQATKTRYGSIFLVYQQNRLADTPRDEHQTRPYFCIFYIKDAYSKAPKTGDTAPVMRITEDYVQNVVVSSSFAIKRNTKVNDMPKPSLDQYLLAIRRVKEQLRQIKLLSFVDRFSDNHVWHFKRHEVLCARQVWRFDVEQVYKQLKKEAGQYGLETALKEMETAARELTLLAVWIPKPPSPNPKKSAPTRDTAGRSAPDSDKKAVNELEAPPYRLCKRTDVPIRKKTATVRKNKSSSRHNPSHRKAKRSAEEPLERDEMRQFKRTKRRTSTKPDRIQIKWYSQPSYANASRK